MEYRIDVSASGNYLMTKLSGRVFAQDVLKAVAATNLKANEIGIVKQLYDLTEAENVDSALENFSLVHDELPRLKFKRSTQVVLLVDPSDHSHDFNETAARNAGYNVTLCRDLKNALTKLGELSSETVQP